jgi:hypothetical protein
LQSQPLPTNESGHSAELLPSEPDSPHTIQGDRVWDGVQAVGAGLSLPVGGGCCISDELKDSDQAMLGTRPQRLASWTEVRSALRRQQEHKYKGSAAAASRWSTGQAVQNPPDLQAVGSKETQE